MRACLKEWKWISEKPFLLGNLSKTQQTFSFNVLKRVMVNNLLMFEDRTCLMAPQHVQIIIFSLLRANLNYKENKFFFSGTSSAFNKDKPLPALPLEDEPTLIESVDDDKDATLEEPVDDTRNAPLEESAEQEDGDQEDTILQVENYYF